MAGPDISVDAEPAKQGLQIYEGLDPAPSSYHYGRATSVLTSELQGHDGAVNVHSPEQVVCQTRVATFNPSNTASSAVRAVRQSPAMRTCTFILRRDDFRSSTGR